MAGGCLDAWTVVYCFTVVVFVEQVGFYRAPWGRVQEPRRGEGSPALKRKPERGDGETALTIWTKKIIIKIKNK